MHYNGLFGTGHKLRGELQKKVPQDLVLGPSVFSIFINDLADYIEHSTLRLFADNSIIYK